jgi:acetylornithine deacetylase
VLDLLNRAIAEEKKRDADFECEVTAARADEGFDTPAESRLVTLLERSTGNKAGTVAFGTEAAQMITMGAEAVVLGPGDIRVAHRTGEFVPLEELQRCVEILRNAIELVCL